MSAIQSPTQQWVDICAIDDLTPEAGCGALFGDAQIALFYVPAEPEQVFVIDNYDPCGKANVLARGLIGNVGERLYVASPLFKQRFDLRTGECLDDSSVKVACYPARVVGGRVEVAS